MNRFCSRCKIRIKSLSILPACTNDFTFSSQTNFSLTEETIVRKITFANFPKRFGSWKGFKLSRSSISYCLFSFITKVRCFLNSIRSLESAALFGLFFSYNTFIIALRGVLLKWGLWFSQNILAFLAAKSFNV